MSSAGCAVSPESRMKRELAQKERQIQDAYAALGEQQVMIADLSLAVAMLQGQIGGDA